MNEIVSIKNFFATYHIQLSTEWLQSCIDWCKQETLPTNYTLKDLQFKVYEQWLLLDLRDVELASLPQDLSNKKLYTLNGNYALQMMKVVDISRPKHWQLQKIRNNDSKNVDEEKESSKRVLQLTLTDGVQEVEAMEYQTIQTLNLNLTPGIKILLMGPITVRRGRLMLQSHNVKVLGGEVEELIVPNAAENILAKCLNLPLNPKPKVIEETLLSANKDIFSEAGGTTSVNPQNQPVTSNVPNQPALPRPLHSNNGQNNQNPIRPGPSTGAIPKPAVQSSNKPTIRSNIGFTSEDEMRIAEEIDMMMEVEREFEQSNKSRNKSNTPDMFEDDMDLNDYDFSKIDAPPTVIKSNTTPVPKLVENNKLTVENNSTLKNDKLQSVINPSESLESQMDFFENIDLDKIEKSVQIPKKTVILSIEKLQRNIPHISNGKFKIKAAFKSIVEKLTVVDEKFHLVVEVEDDSGHLAVKFHSDVVSELAECCPATLLSLKKGIVEENAGVQTRVLETLKRLKEKLLLLDSVLEVQINGKDSRPVVVNIFDTS